MRDARTDLFFFHLLDLQRQRDVLISGHRIQQVELLKDKADAVAAKPHQGVSAQAGDVAAIYIDAAAAHPIDRGDAVQQRRLA